MSAQPTIPRADTRPTKTREGREIEPTRVQCPTCGENGFTECTINLCGQCGHWFEVVTEEEGDD